jgi:hypothetical protein
MGNVQKYIILGFFFLFPLTAFTQEIELPKENSKDFVYMVLPYGIDFVRDHINLQFDSDARAYYEDYNGAIYALPDQAKTISDLSSKARKGFISFPLVRSNKFYVFYGNYKNMQHVLQNITPYSVLGLYNPALARYAELGQRHLSVEPGCSLLVF